MTKLLTRCGLPNSYTQKKAFVNISAMHSSSIIYSSLKSLEFTIPVFLGVEFIVSFFMPPKFTDDVICEKHCTGPVDSMLMRPTLTMLET